MNEKIKLQQYIRKNNEWIKDKVTQVNKLDFYPGLEYSTKTDKAVIVAFKIYEKQYWINKILSGDLYRYLIQHAPKILWGIILFFLYWLGKITLNEILSLY